MEIVSKFKSLIEPKIETYVAVMDPQPGKPLWDKIETSIKGSNYLVVIMTKNGARSKMVQSEIATAKALKIPVIPIIEQGVELNGILAGIEYISIDNNHPGQALKEASVYLSKLKKLENIDSIAKLVLAFLGIYALSQLSD
jgi:hypothetical protein